MIRTPRAVILSLSFLVSVVALTGQQANPPIVSITIGPPDSLTFIGHPDSLTFELGELTNLMRLRAPKLLSGGTPFSRRALKVDALTIEHFYFSHGYLEARVDESFTITPDGGVEVYLRVNEGRPFMLSEVTITGDRLLSREEIVQFLGIQIGEPYNPVGIRDRLEALRHHYQDQGKLTIDILEEIEVNDDVHLRLTISEGLTYLIGNVMVSGLQQIPEWYVTRELLFHRGDVFNRSKLLLSQQRVFESGLFSAVEITPLVQAEEPRIAHIEVRVRELGRGSFDFSAGFSQKEAARGGEPNTALSSSFQWWHSRLLNTSLRTGITLEGNLLWERWWPPDFLAAGEIVSPWTMGIRLPSSVRLYSDYRTVPETIWRQGVDLSLLPKRTQRHQPRGSIGLVWIETAADPDSIAAGAEGGFRLEYLFQGADNLLAPRRGTIFQIKYSLQRTFLTGNPLYHLAELDIRRYHTLFQSAVFAYRFKAGYLMTAPSGVRLRRYHLFDLGGSTSLRGWSKPSSFSEEGGMAKWLVNIELRVPLIWILGAEFFIDAGGLWAYQEPDDPTLEWIWGWDTGAGLLITTPLGPVRIDVAFPWGDNPTLQTAFLYTF
ncbi:MAG: BamA/TamA family outer membrane protein [Fidelibacterota bacterium]|nr:MAG: BamA/TamA family outer membrane protein [Candidatus Neomarinimicrobiota bacterium]